MVRLRQGGPSSSAPDGLTVMQFSSELSLFSPYIQSPLVFDIRKSRLRAAAKTFVPQASALSVDLTRAPSPALNEQAPTSRVEPTATISIKDLEAPAMAEEIEAAIVIQVAYRRALKRRAAPPPKDGRVKLWYCRCIDAQMHLRGSKTYLKYFLGPLVHVLIWADSMVRLLRKRKDRAKKKFRHADHRQIEDLMERLAVCK